MSGAKKPRDPVKAEKLHFDEEVDPIQKRRGKKGLRIKQNPNAKPATAGLGLGIPTKG